MIDAFKPAGSRTSNSEFYAYFRPKDPLSSPFPEREALSNFFSAGLCSTRSEYTNDFEQIYKTKS